MRRGLVLGILTSLLLTACGPASAPTPQKPQPQAAGSSAGPTRLTIIYGAQPIEGMGPYAQSAGITNNVWKHVLESLVHWDTARREMRPLLAERWETPSPDTWRFHLRRGVKFHDGSELTAADVVHSYNRILNDPDTKQRSSLANIVGMETPDAYTVDLKTKGPDATLLDSLDDRFITSKAHYDRLGKEAADAEPIGTGPYRFKEWVQGQRFVIVRNEAYNGPHRATPEEVIFRGIAEDEARVTALLNGEADIITYLAPQLVARVEGSGVAHIASAPGQRMMFLAMNPNHKPWDNLLVRQAVSHALDRKELIDGVLSGRAYPLDGPIGPPQFAYTPDLQPKYPYDPERGRQLLAQAGYPNGVDVELFSPAGRYIKDKEMAQAIGGQLARIGMRARVTPQDWGIFWPAVNDGKVPFWFGGRGSITDPSEYLHQYFRTGLTKRLQFSDPEIDALLDKERTVLDQAERVKALQQVMSEIMKKAAMAFVLMYEDTYGVSNRVEFSPRTDEKVYAWDVRFK